MTAASLHFTQVWPLSQGQLLPYLQEAQRVVCVEGNATGQLARLIHTVTGFRIVEHVLRYDGLPIDSAYIVDGIAVPGCSTVAGQRGKTW